MTYGSSISSLVADVVQAMRNLQPGERFVYFTGSLDEERHNTPNSESCFIASAAYSLMQEGKVTLVQQRIGRPIDKDGMLDWQRGCGAGFRYIAVGAKPKNSPRLQPTITPQSTVNA